MDFLENHLVEGIDQHQEYELPIDQDWKEINAAQRNNQYLQKELVGVDIVHDSHVGIVYVGGVMGMIPIKFSGCNDIDEFKRLLGVKIAFKIHSTDRSNNIFVGSRQAALETLMSVAWSRLEEGKVILGAVKEVHPNRMKVDVGAAVVTLKAEDMSYAWIDDLRDHYKLNDRLRVQILQMDKEARTLQVSHKATLPNPFPDCFKRYSVGASRIGEVTGIVEYGVFVNLEPGVDILCKPQRVNARTALKRKDKVEVRILDTDTKKNRLFGRVERKL